VSDVLHSPLGLVFGTSVGVSMALLGYLGYVCWASGRTQRRWQREDEVHRQLWQLEDQIWQESLPDRQREAIDEADRKRVAIRQEARRRLGLPEEDT
jgi:hypothetical protein